MKKMKLVLGIFVLLFFVGCYDGIKSDKPLTKKSFKDSLLCGKKFGEGKNYLAFNCNQYPIKLIINNPKNGKKEKDIFLSQLANGNKYVSFISYNSIGNFEKTFEIKAKYEISNDILKIFIANTDNLKTEKYKNIKFEKIKRKKWLGADWVIIDTAEKIQQFVIKNDDIFSEVQYIIDKEKADMCFDKNAKNIMGNSYDRICSKFVDLKEKLKKEAAEKKRKEELEKQRKQELAQKKAEERKKQEQFQNALKSVGASKITKDSFDTIIDRLEDGASARELHNEVIVLPKNNSDFKLEKLSGAYALYSKEGYNDKEYHILIQIDEDELYTKGTTFKPGWYKFVKVKKVDMGLFSGSKQVLVYKRVAID